MILIIERLAGLLMMLLIFICMILMWDVEDDLDFYERGYAWICLQHLVSFKRKHKNCTLDKKKNI
jgi:hypothetical protein